MKIIFTLFFIVLYIQIIKAAIQTCNSVTHETQGCSSHGFCVATDTCNCFAGYFGTYCETEYRDLIPYVIGNNDFGQMGVALSTASSQTFVATDDPVANQTVIGLDSGLRSQFILYPNSVYASGIAKHIGIGTTSTTATYPHRNISYSETVRLISSSSHTFVLTASNTVWAWGDMSNLKESSEDILSNPTLVDISGLTGATIIDIQTSHYHDLILTIDGLVFTRGQNRGADALGLGQNIASYDVGSVYVQTEFKNISSMSSYTIHLIAASLTGGCAVSTNNDLLCWGSNAKGELGINNAITEYALVPQQSVMTNFGGEKIKQISGGSPFQDDLRQAYYLALTTTGKVFGWGSNSKSKLALGGTSRQFIPIQIGSSQFTKPILQIQCGQDANLALDESGNVFIWGQLISGTTYSVPTQIDISSITATHDVVDLNMGFDTAAIVTKEKPYCNGIISTSESVCSGFGNCTDHEVCQCQPNYYGQYCNVTYCFGEISNGTSRCTSTSRGYCPSYDHCSCYDGYTGQTCQNFICNSISSAESTVCGGQGTCSNVETCQCNSQYYDQYCDNWNCSTISRKNESVCSGHGTCYGPELCSCQTGWVGSNCEIPVCFSYAANDTSRVCSGNGTCTSPGVCQCNSGYNGTDCSLYDCFGYLSNDEKVCTGRGSCTSPGNCVCQPSYRFSDCSGDPLCFGVSGSQACSGHGNCTATDTCQCESQYYGSNCTITECYGVLSNQSTVCNGQGSCTALNQCQCNSLYTGSQCTTPSCYGLFANDASVCNGHGTCSSLNNCQCSSKWHGSNCTIPECYGTRANESSVCNGQGTCTGSDQCQCNSNYTGSQCTTPSCNGVLGDQPTVCSGRGQCIGLNQCNCTDPAQTNYTGQWCNTPMCEGVAATDSSVCLGRGTCVSPNNCSCQTGYSGSNCQSFVTPQCGGKPYTDASVCNNHGTCTATDQCSCQSGYFGNLCQYHTCYGVLNSDSLVCGGHGNCTAVDTCQCESNWLGQSCSVGHCYGITSNSSTVCSQNGYCIDGGCVCLPGYQGNCDATQQSNLVCFGKSGDSACSGHGTCSQPNTCSCQTDYFGIQCEYHSCSGVASFESTACSGHGTCSSQNNCSCQTGYSGSTCSTYTCYTVSNSDANVCSGHGSCTGLDQCQCQSGYYGSDCSTAATCPQCSTHSSCTDGSTCQCHNSTSNGFWQGSGCDSCQSGYYGSDCKTTFSQGWTIREDGSGLIGDLQPDQTQVSCDSLFGDVSKLGSDPRCYWESGTFKIDFGQNPTLTSSDQLLVKVTTSSKKKAILTSTVAVSISQTTPSTKPVAILGGPLTTSSCAAESVVLDGSASYSLDRRPLTYQWKCLNGATSQITAVLEQGNQSSIIEISNSLLTAGTTYIFTLQVKNYLQVVSDTKTLMITRSSSAQGIPTIQASPIFSIPYSEEINLQATASQLSCITDLSQIQYQWSQLSGPSIQLPDSNQATLNISSNTFPPIQATYQLQVLLKTGSLEAKQTMFIETKLRDLVPIISGGSRLVIPDSSGKFTLDATESYDPESLSDSASYKWVCWVKTTLASCPGSLKLAALSGSQHTLTASDFSAGSYIFTLYYYKKQRVASTSVTLEFVADTTNYPQPTLLSKQPTFNQNSELPLMVSRTERTSTLQWSSTPSLPSSINLTPLSGRVALLQSDSLLPGNSYSFKLSMTSQQGQVSYVSLQSKSNYVTPGLLIANGQTTGTVGETVFSFGSVQWINAQYEYEFYIWHQQLGRYVVLQKSPLPYCKTKLPWVGTITVGVRVKNVQTQASFQLESQTVQVQATSSSLTSLIDTVVSDIGKAMTLKNYREARKLLVVASELLQSNNQEAQATTTTCLLDCSGSGTCSNGVCSCTGKFGDDCRHSSKADMDKYQGYRTTLFGYLNSLPKDSDFIQQDINIFEELMSRPSELTDDIFSQALLYGEALLNLVQTSVVAHPQRTISQPFNVIGNCGTSCKGPSARNSLIAIMKSLNSLCRKETSLQKLQELIQQTGTVLALTQYPGQNQTTLSYETSSLSLARIDGADWASTTLTGTNPLQQSFSVQAEVTNQDNAMVSISAAVLDANPYADSEVGSQIVSVQILDDKLQALTSGSVSVLLHKSLTHLANDLGIDGECHQWTGSAWSSSGCQRVSGTSTSTQCRCDLSGSIGIYAVKYVKTEPFVFPYWTLTFIIPVVALCLVIICTLYCCTICCLCLCGASIKVVTRKPPKIVPSKEPLGNLDSIKQDTDSWGQHSDVSYLGIYKHESDDEDDLFMKHQQEGSGINVDEDGIGDDTIRNLILLFSGKSKEIEPIQPLDFDQQQTGSKEQSFGDEPRFNTAEIPMNSSTGQEEELQSAPSASPAAQDGVVGHQQVFFDPIESDRDSEDA